jgi:hypothetical protein
MIDVEIAKQTIATLTDKLNAATKRAGEIAAERQKIGYLVHVGNDKAAQAKLAKLTADFPATLLSGRELTGKMLSDACVA